MAHKYTETLHPFYVGSVQSRHEPTEWQSNLHTLIQQKMC